MTLYHWDYPKMYKYPKIFASISQPPYQLAIIFGNNYINYTNDSFVIANTFCSVFYYHFVCPTRHVTDNVYQNTD